jgi:hypothetical protein
MTTAGTYPINILAQLTSSAGGYISSEMNNFAAVPQGSGTMLGPTCKSPRIEDQEQVAALTTLAKLPNEVMHAIAARSVATCQ